MPDTKLNILSRLSRTIAQKTALYFPEDRWNDLERKAFGLAKEFGYSDLEEFTNYLESTPNTKEQIEILAAHLTINETYFWREPQVFEALEHNILPELIKMKKNTGMRLRIWCAGCSTGEEPYSIAIALKRIIPDINNWSILIHATDINPRQLKKAVKGKYRMWSFRNTPVWLKELYFKHLGEEKYEILPEIKKMVNFEILNFADETFQKSLFENNKFDLIFCRNVLMYFSQDKINQIGRVLRYSLIENGYLIVAASELSLPFLSKFEAVNLEGAIVHKKSKKASFKPFQSYYDKEISKQSMSNYTLESSIDYEQNFPIFIPFADKSSQIEDTDVSMTLKASDKLINKSKSKEIKIIDMPDNKQAATDLILEVRTLANQGKLTEALSLCEKSIAANKLNPYMYFLFATILFEESKVNESIAALQKAIYLDQNFVLSHYTLGNIYLSQGNKRNAKKSFKNALEILDKFNHDEIIPESDGMTAGRFKEFINSKIMSGVM